MKTIFRFVKMGLVLTALAVVGATAVLAQDPCADTAAINALDAKFRENWEKKAWAERQVAVDAGKEYLEKYGNCESVKEIADYLKTAIPTLEAGVKAQRQKEELIALYKRFDDSIKAKKYEETYAAGKEIVAKYPENSLDQILAMGSIGYDESYNKNYKYNDDTLRFAKMAISHIESGKTSKKYGLYQWEYKTKENAVGWMNLTVGYITYYANKDKKGALPYLYKASQASSDTKTNPLVFEAIGAYYFDEVSKLAEEVKKMIADQKETDTPEVKTQKEADIKAKIALLNGYAERAMDAYARAHKVAKSDPSVKAYKEGLYKTLQTLYNVRFAKTDGMDSFIAGLVSKPMPDPTSTVTPIVEEPKTTDTTTGSPAGAAMASTTARPVVATPAAATTTKTRAPARKPVKKKGTR